MRIALLAGEPSGDQLGAALIEALREINPTITFDGVGGPLMAAQGFQSLIPMAGFSVMGLSEIIKALPRLLNYKKQLLKHFQAHPPDVFVGIDYPEFNFKIEKKLRSLGVFTVHYVSPSVWAWREGRIQGIKSACDLMLTLFEFEKAFYDKHQLPAVYCGHPLVDLLSRENDTEKARKTLGLVREQHYLAMLPGSRLSEVERMLPIFVETAQKMTLSLPRLFCLIPAATPAIEKRIQNYFSVMAPTLNYQLFSQQGKMAMQAADAVLLASGTATLEAMLLEKPMLVAYQVSRVTAFLAKRLVHTRYFSLPNLLADKAVVPEFIQTGINTTEMANQLTALISDKVVRQVMIDELVAIRQTMRGQAAQTAAMAIYTGAKAHRG